MRRRGGFGTPRPLTALIRPVPPTSRADGDSAIQIAVVLALAMILATAAVAGIAKAVAKETLDGWARTMTFDIAAGRQAAITQRATVTVTMSSSSYLVANGGISLRYAMLPPTITISTTCPATICSFDRRGVPINAGSITLTSPSIGQSRVVTIQSNTGRVSFQ